MPLWRPRTRLFDQLSVILDLLRELNSLLREDIEIRTGRPARTPLSPTTTPLPPLPAPPKPVTLDDVQTHRGMTRSEPQVRWQGDAPNARLSTDPLTPSRLDPNGTD